MTSPSTISRLIKEHRKGFLNNNRILTTFQHLPSFNGLAVGKKIRKMNFKDFHRSSEVEGEEEKRLAEKKKIKIPGWKSVQRASFIHVKPFPKGRELRAGDKRICQL